MPSNNRYNAIIEKIFFDHYQIGERAFEFTRQEIKEAADNLLIAIPDNIGDLIYTFRFRSDLPDSILATQQNDLEWVIELAGRAVYRFNLVKVNRVIPRDDLITIDIPDATPELIRAYALDDEQALLAIVRYNRLIDTFLGLTTYSLQNHLRTTVQGVGQIEIDELYIGLDRNGCHYIIPVQAKGGSDQIGIVQITQDLKYSEQKFPGMRCRAIAAQFMAGSIVVLFELTIQNEEVRIVDEKHYRLVSSDKLNRQSVISYRDF